MTTKVTLELKAEKLVELDQIVADGGFADRKELFDNALAIVKWAIRHAKAGHNIAAVDEVNKKYHELSMPFLTGISKQ